MDKQKAESAIFEHALPLAPFEGWTQRMLGNAAQAAGYKRTDAVRVFPGGAIDAADRYFRMVDQHMLDMLESYHLESMKIRERIAAAVRIRLIYMEPHKEAVRKIVALQSMPFHAHHALTSLYHTVDDIWHGIGDTSTDFNFYTKRLILGAVYSSTLLFWLDDKSAGHEMTWAFLARRIEDVMKFEKAKAGLRQWLKKVS